MSEDHVHDAPESEVAPSEAPSDVVPETVASEEQGDDVEHEEASREDGESATGEPHGHAHVTESSEVTVGNGDTVDAAEAASEAEHDAMATPVESGSTEEPPAATPPPPPTAEGSTLVAGVKRAATKPASLVKPTGKSGSSGPPTPLVKKIINSGTFGSGAVKPASSMVSRTSVSGSATTARPTATTTVKKPVGTTLMATKSESKPSAVGSAPSTAVARRLSTVTKTSAPAAGKGSLSSSTGARATPVSALAKAPSTSSASKTAPTPNSTAATRPRASVSEGVTSTVRKPVSTRPSISSSPAKPSPATAATRTRTAGGASISSIKEVKQDTKAVEALQEQLDQLTSSLKEKDARISALEAQLVTLGSGSEARYGSLEKNQESRPAIEKELADSKAELEALRAERDGHSSVLEEVKAELQEAKSSTATQIDLVNTLRAQIGDLESEIRTSKEKLDALQSAHSQVTADAAQAASIEHDALIKAQADLAAIAEETEALRTAHATAFEQATGRVQELEAHAARATELEAELTQLKKDKEESANRVSELEVEILEARELVENAEDAHGKATSELKSLEEQLAAAIAASEKLTSRIAESDVAHGESAEAMQKQHEGALRAAKEEQDAITAQLSAAQEELRSALADHEQSKTDFHSAETERARVVAATEEAHTAQLGEHSAEIARLTAELEGQESKYGAKVDAVKAEHNQLLQEAFERAKNEAGAAHGGDLQALRVQSQEMIEQLRQSHQTTIDDLKKQHETEVAEQTSVLEKKLASQALELKATQDDLSKAKAAIAATIPETEALKSQLEQAQQSAVALAASSSSEHVAEIERLLRELAAAKDDVTAHQEILTATKETISEMSSNHSKELEEAAKGRAEEVTRLRGIHEAERESLRMENADLATRLSDLEGEITTLKAKLEADTPMSPKSNGATPVVAQGVTKEELQRLHEAHNLKIRDLEAEHEKALKTLREEVEGFQSKAEELAAEVGRKAMEIQYLEQEQDEQTDTITRLEEELAAAKAPQPE